MRVWIAAAAPGDETETLYEADLPACCQRSSRSEESFFECLSCGAKWQEPQPVYPEVESQERRGAA